MSILGISSLKIKDVSSNIITIPNVFGRSYNWSDDDREHSSDIDGAKLFDAEGDHLVFTCNANLFKHADVLTYFDTLHGKYKTTVYLAPLGDHYLKDSSGNEVLFFFKKLFLYHLETADFKDAINLEFHSLKYVDLSESIQTVIYDDLLEGITDDKDELIST